MRPIIKKLNDKGWVTKYCCQGHWKNNGYFGTYIGFEKPIDINIEHCKQMDIYPSQTKGAICYHNKSKTAWYFNHSQYKRMTKEKKDEEHKIIIEELLRWAESLEKYGE